MNKKVKFIIIAVIVLLAVIILVNSIATVNTGFVGVKTRFGEVQDTMINEGFNFKVPFIEKIVKIDCRTQKCEYTMEASSKDLQKISNIQIALNYNVDKSKANQLYKTVGTNYTSVLIEPSIYESVKQGMSQYTAEELVTKRSEVSNIIIELLKEKLEDKGILITALNIINLSFSEEFDAAIEAKQITEQQTQQAKYELEKARVENEKKIENAKAEAEVMKQQNSQITEQYLRLKEIENQKAMIDKWDGHTPTTVLGDSTGTLFNINQ